MTPEVEEWLDTLEQPECQWPIVVEAVTEYIVWIDGDSPEAALAYAKDYPDIYEMLDSGSQEASWLRVEAPSWNEGSQRNEQYGPIELCATCGPIHVVSPWYHKPECDRHPKTVAEVA